MNFWDWMDKDFDRTRGPFGYLKGVCVLVIVFILVPLLIYFIVAREDPGAEKEGLGLYIIVGLYWGGAYFAYTRHHAKRRLNQLLDKLLDKDKEGLERLFKEVERRREDRFSSLSMEDKDIRVRWFDIE